MTKVKTAIFPVGGLGTRFLPATKSMPKEMLPILDKPLIQYAFEEAKNAGIEKFIFITGRNKNIIANHFDHAYELESVLEEKEKEAALKAVKDWIPEAGAITFTRQQQALGLGHAVLCAKNFVNEPFALLLPDEMFLSKQPVVGQMIEAFEEQDSNIIAVQKIPQENVGSYGVIKPSGEYDDADKLIQVDSLVEKPNPSAAPSDLAIVGRYILKPEIFDYLETQQAGYGGEIQLTDSINKMTLDRKVKTFGMKVEAQRFDCGSRKGFLEANIAMALSHDDLKDDVIKLMKEIISESESVS